MGNSGILLMLKGCEIFKSLKSEELEKLSTHSSLRRVYKGDMIYRSKEKATYIYMIVKGAVKLEAETSNGNCIIKNLSFENELIGENVFIDDPLRSENAVAVIDTTCIEISTEAFRNLAADNMAFANSIILNMVEKIGGLEKRIESYKHRKAKGRILGFITELAKKHSKFKEKVGTILHHGLSHIEIAQITDTSRQTVARVMSELKKEGLIDFADRRPHTLRVDKLLS